MGCAQQLTCQKTNHMQKQMTSIPGYGIFEYLLVMRPHEELQQQLLAIKKEFAGVYKAPAALHTYPNIALVNFYAYQMTQERIVNRIGNVALGINPFKVELNGFGAFPSHTIYTSVSTRTPIQELVRELKGATSLLTLNKEHKPHFIENPHFTICHKLKPWQFEKAWLAYSHRSFSGRFIADHLLLLRRPASDTRYESIMRFEFQSLAVTTKQGSLFM
jgi:2'-5' RNA ligase